MINASDTIREIDAFDSRLKNFNLEKDVVDPEESKKYLDMLHDRIQKENSHKKEKTTRQRIQAARQERQEKDIFEPNSDNKTIDDGDLEKRDKKKAEKLKILEKRLYEIEENSKEKAEMEKEDKYSRKIQTTEKLPLAEVLTRIQYYKNEKMVGRIVHELIKNLFEDKGNEATGALHASAETKNSYCFGFNPWPKRRWEDELNTPNFTKWFNCLISLVRSTEAEKFPQSTNPLVIISSVEPEKLKCICKMYRLKHIEVISIIEAIYYKFAELLKSDDTSAHEALKSKKNKIPSRFIPLGGETSVENRAKCFLAAGAVIKMCEAMKDISENEEPEWEEVWKQVRQKPSFAQEISWKIMEEITESRELGLSGVILQWPSDEDGNLMIAQCLESLLGNQNITEEWIEKVLSGKPPLNQEDDEKEERFISSISGFVGESKTEHPSALEKWMSEVSVECVFCQDSPSECSLFAYLEESLKNMAKQPEWSSGNSLAELLKLRKLRGGNLDLENAQELYQRFVDTEDSFWSQCAMELKSFEDLSVSLDDTFSDVCKQIKESLSLEDTPKNIVEKKARAMMRVLRQTISSADQIAVFEAASEMAGCFWDELHSQLLQAQKSVDFSSLVESWEILFVGLVNKLAQIEVICFNSQSQIFHQFFQKVAGQNQCAMKSFDICSESTAKSLRHDVQMEMSVELPKSPLVCECSLSFNSLYKEWLSRLEVRLGWLLSCSPILIEGFTTRLEGKLSVVRSVLQKVAHRNDCLCKSLLQSIQGMNTPRSTIETAEVHEVCFPIHIDDCMSG